MKNTNTKMYMLLDKLKVIIAIPDNITDTKIPILLPFLSESYGKINPDILKPIKIKNSSNQNNIKNLKTI